MIVQYIMIQYGIIIRYMIRENTNDGEGKLTPTSNQIDIFINTFITFFSLASLCQTTFYIKAIILLQLTVF